MTVPAILADSGYGQLKVYILEHTGLNYYADKDEDLAARLGRRMKASGTATCAEYLRLLADGRFGDTERDALIGELTIGETYFFRQMEHFDLLRTTIIPDLIERNQRTRKLRIWSAGCATGAEPYSIALLLRLEFREILRDWDVSILATDINVDFLAQARSGRFGDWALRDLPDSLRMCCFSRDGRSWVLNPEYVADVRFERHNLATGDSYPGSVGDPMDLILCRNVLIYFSRDRIRAVAERLFDSLSRGGWLLVGHAEPNAEWFGRFELVNNNQSTAYRRPLDGVTVQPQTFTWQPWAAPLDVSVSRKRTPPRTVEGPIMPELPRSPVPLAPNADAARALADAGDWNGAGALCRSLISSDPLNAPAHFTLGLVLAHNGEGNEAEAAFRRSIYLDRRFALAHYHLGLLLQAGGRTAQAERSFRNVVNLLRSVPPDEVLTHGDGIKAAELNELAAMHCQSSPTTR